MGQPFSVMQIRGLEQDHPTTSIGKMAARMFERFRLEENRISA